MGIIDADLDEFTAGRPNGEAKWEMESSFDIGNGSRLRKLSICNRSMGSSFEASKSRLEIVSSVLEGINEEANLRIALATCHCRAWLESHRLHLSKCADDVSAFLRFVLRLSTVPERSTNSNAQLAGAITLSWLKRPFRFLVLVHCLLLHHGSLHGSKGRLQAGHGRVYQISK